MNKEEAWRELGDDGAITEEIAKALELSKICVGMTRVDVEDMLGIKLEED